MLWLIDTCQNKVHVSAEQVLVLDWIAGSGQARLNLYSSLPEGTLLKVYQNSECIILNCT